MKESVKDAAIDLVNLLTRFSFDLNGSTAKQLVSYWLSRYPAYWVQFALLEALYQGRYKARSIEQILALWQRRGYPLYHFNHEFERIIRGRFSRHLPMQSPMRTNLPIAQVLPSKAGKSKLASDAASVNRAPDVPAIDPARSIPLANELPIELPSKSMPSESLFNESPSESSSESVPSELSPVNPLSSDASLPTDQLAIPAPISEPNAELAEELIQSLRLLSSAESIAFLKLRNFETAAASAELLEDELAADSARELPIQAFKPMALFQSETITKMKELALTANRAPVEEIQQFVPTAESSDFYSKLKAVATERSKAVAGQQTSDAASR
jgi:hypothetical protein